MGIFLIFFPPHKYFPRVVVVAMSYKLAFPAVNYRFFVYYTPYLTFFWLPSLFVSLNIIEINPEV